MYCINQIGGTYWMRLPTDAIMESDHESMPSLNWKIPDQSVSGESLQGSADQIWLTQPWFPLLVSVALRRPIQIIII